MTGQYSTEMGESIKQIEDLMHNTHFISKCTVTDAAKIMIEKKLGSVLVPLDKEGPLQERFGIVTERDILVKVIAKGLHPDNVFIEEIMCTPIKIIEHDAKIRTASRWFNMHSIRRLPVYQGDKIIGLVSARDVAKFLIFMLDEIMNTITKDEYIYDFANPKLKEVMHRAVVITERMNMVEAARVMRDHGMGSCFVLNFDREEGPMEKRYGIITERDIVEQISQGWDSAVTCLRQIATPEVRSIMDVEDRITHASKAINIHNIRHIPIKEDDRLVGIITARDIAKYYVFAFDQILERLKEIDPDQASEFEDENW